MRAFLEARRRFHARFFEPILTQRRHGAALELVGHAVDCPVDVEQVPFTLRNDGGVGKNVRTFDDVGNFDNGALLHQRGDHRRIAIDQIEALATGQRGEHHLVVVGFGLDHFDFETEMLFEFGHEQLMFRRVLAAGHGGQNAQILRHRGRAQDCRAHEYESGDSHFCLHVGSPDEVASPACQHGTGLIRADARAAR